MGFHEGSDVGQNREAVSGVAEKRLDHRIVAVTRIFSSSTAS
jgi:hypothetical protein